MAATAANSGGMLAWRFSGVSRHPWVFPGAIAAAPVLAYFLIQTPVPMAFAGWSFVLIAGLTCLTVIDAQTRTVPDLVAIPMVILGLIHAATQDGLLISFAVSSLGVVGIGMLVGLVTKNRGVWIGGGDVLLFAGALAWLGPAVAPDVIFLTGLGLLVVYSFRSIMRFAKLAAPYSPDHFMPLAPALGLAQMTIWLGGPLF